MMHFARFARLDDEPDRGAQSLADQMMMHGRRGEQRRNCDAVGSNLPVRHDDDVVAAAHGVFGALTQPCQRVAHSRRALLGRISDVERLRVEGVFEVSDRANLFEIRIRQDRLAHFEALAPRCAFQVEYVRPRSDERHEAHHQLFADRIDRRVGHLREVLLEIGVEHFRMVGERRDRRVRSHRADRFLARHRHRAT